MKEYFFGHYFKCQSDDGTAAFIPAIHKKGKAASASLQIITDDGAWNVPFSVCEYKKLGGAYPVALGKNEFRRDGISLSVDTDEVKANGEITFGDFSPIGGDIMGPFRFVPFLECRHSVVSMAHSLSGSVTVNGKTFDFTGGKGYIEGDRGRSFPEVYLWTHAFFPGGSLMLSVAKIPLGFMNFTGIIGVVMKDGREYRVMTLHMWTKNSGEKRTYLLTVLDDDYYNVKLYEDSVRRDDNGMSTHTVIHDGVPSEMTVWWTHSSENKDGYHHVYITWTASVPVGYDGLVVGMRNRNIDAANLYLGEYYTSEDDFALYRLN